ncbi:MAG: hypothetical protein CL512_03970 [Actinobacteria bacterium]|nr:hypothetical protein [Actinomycetota bacterium]|tara:strand:- start:125 stop:1210 length:1086 start_codon:yes stop_codon:yes gene_type:complete
MSYSNYETSVVINTTKMEGVTSANGSYGINESPITVAGFGFTDAFLSEAPQGNFSFDKKLVARDPLVWPGDADWDASTNYNKMAFVKREGVSYESIEKSGPDHGGHVEPPNDSYWSVVDNRSVFDERNYFSGAILYGEKGFGFNKGRLTRYSISCGIDEIPNVHAEFSVLGEISPNIVPVFDPTFDQAIQIPSQGSIEVTCVPEGEDELFSSNYVTNFSYEKTINLEQIYALPTGIDSMWQAGTPIDVSNTDPIQVDIVDPVEIDLNFSIVINDHETKDMRKRLIETQANHIEISIKNPETNEVINRFVAPYARLLSESVSASTDNEITAELSFKSYMNKNWYGTSHAFRKPMFLPTGSAV